LAPAKDISTVLAAFPGPVTLYRSMTKWLIMLLGCVAFTGGGIAMIQSHEESGWLVAIFFGVGTLVSLVALLPGGSYVKLDRDGFEISSLYRRSRVLWKSATGFEVRTVPPSSKAMVVFDDAEAKRRALAALNVTLVGHNSALPDTYGFEAADLAVLMARWREHAVSLRDG
jgi:hypothetical protein